MNTVFFIAPLMPLNLLNLKAIRCTHMANINVIPPPCDYGTLQPLSSGNVFEEESLTRDERCEALNT